MHYRSESSQWDLVEGERLSNELESEPNVHEKTFTNLLIVKDKTQCKLEASYFSCAFEHLSPNNSYYFIL